MASTTEARERKRSASTTAAAARYIPIELVRKILLRLPSRSVLRFRAVCKAWLHLLSDPDFALEHHQLQPDMRLVSFLRGGSEELGPVEHCVKALNLRTGDFLVVRFTDTKRRWLCIHGSCDGLLLLSYEGGLDVCNPATHQWTRLEEPAYSSHFLEFYRHDPTGEYRAMFYCGNGSSRNYYILVPRPGVRRWIGPLPLAEDGYNFGSDPSGDAALLHGNLHWPPEQWGNHRILVFDTATEVFNWMRPQPVIREICQCLRWRASLPYLAVARTSEWLNSGFCRITRTKCGFANTMLNCLL